MRFTRFERYDPVRRNARRESAFAGKQTRKRDRYPLFTDHVAADQHSADDEFARRQRQSDRFEATQRAFHARVWRESRTRFFSLPEPVKQQIRDKWRAWTGPTTSPYFSFMVDELSGDQARRVAEAAARQREYMRARISPPTAAEFRIWPAPTAATTSIPSVNLRPDLARAVTGDV